MSVVLITGVLLAAGFFVGWTIGANDAANCIGTVVGSGLSSYKRAIILMAIFVFLGAALQGHHVMKTIGKGIIKTELPDLAIFVALLSAGVFVTLATFLGLPTSTSQAIVGGVAGVGIAALGFHSTHIQFSVLKKILLCWVLCPMLTMALSAALYVIVNFFIKKVRRGSALTSIISWFVIASSCYVAYSLGANDVGNSIGPLLNKYHDKGLWLALFGGAALVTGALTFGRRVTQTVGKSIVPLDLGGAFAAQTSAAFGVHFFSVLGIPVSTSQAIVGAVIGTGVVRGIRMVRVGKIGEIMVGWIATPACAAIFAGALYGIIRAFIA